MLIQYKRNGRCREVNAKVGKLLIGRGLAVEAGDAPEPASGYDTRMMQADPAPFGYKADGTPRKRTGRPAKDE